MKRQMSGSESPLNHFDSLSEEIVFTILDFLCENPVDRKAFSLACRSFYVFESRHRKLLKPFRAEHLKKVLGRYPYVTNLDLSSCPRITDESLFVVADSSKEWLKSINLSMSNVFTNVGLSNLTVNCRNLVEIDVSHATELTDLAAAAIAAAKNLERLWMVWCKSITDIGIGCIAVGCKKLKLLSLKLCLGVGDLGVKILAAKCKDLRSLDLSFLPITKKCLPQIFELKHLEDLVLEGCLGLDDEALAGIKQCKSLEKLDMSSCVNVSDVGLFSLTTAAGCLRQLSLSYGFCVDAALANSLHKFSALQSVKFHGCEITCSGLQCIGNWCSSLRELSLIKCIGVTDKGLSFLVSRHKDLRKLDLTCCRKITAVSVSCVMNSCASLVSLKMESCTSVSVDAFVSIGQLCPLLEELDLTDNEIDDEGMKSISRCAELSILKLGICLNITDEGLIHVGMHCSKIKELDLYRSSGISDLGILAVSRGCPNLEMLNTSYCKSITNQSLISLSKCSKMKALELRGCALITSLGLAAIAEGCRQLAKLDVKKCHSIDDSGILPFAHYSQNLKQINLSYTAASDISLLSLARISCLQSITVVHLEGLAPIGLATALLACGSLMKAKLHTTLKSLLPQFLVEHLESRGCFFQWSDSVFKAELDPLCWKLQLHEMD